MPLYDFRCAVGHIEERLAPRDETDRVCSCGVFASRVGVYRTAHAVAGKPPISLKRVFEADQEMKYSYNRAGLIPPDLPGAARRVAADMRRKGEA